MPRRGLIGRRRFLAAAGLAGAAPLAAPAIARERVRWTLVTSWPRELPGPGVTARRLAERIAAMSEGRLTLELYGAGEIVPALEVFDAVARGVADAGHSASFFWRGKMPAAVFFTAIPFGLSAAEHAAWVYHGGGQELWDALYADLGVKPLMAGNTGMQMGGWFKRPITGLDDLRGLRMRIPGLGGEVMRRLGVVPVALPPSEILPALASGAVDAAEFLGPWSDRAFGFQRVAPVYHWPGFHEPNGTGEFLVNRARFAALSADLKAVVVNACAAEDAFARAEADWHNAEALATIAAEGEVRLLPFPDEVLRAAHRAAAEVLEGLAAEDAAAARIWQSYRHALARARAWSRVGLGAFLAARDRETE